MAKNNSFAGWFYKQSFLIQLLLLLIPGVNWVVEVGFAGLRFSKTVA